MYWRKQGTDGCAQWMAMRDLCQHICVVKFNAVSVCVCVSVYVLLYVQGIIDSYVSSILL